MKRASIFGGVFVAAILTGCGDDSSNVDPSAAEVSAPYSYLPSAKEVAAHDDNAYCVTAIALFEEGADSKSEVGEVIANISMDFGLKPSMYMMQYNETEDDFKLAIKSYCNLADSVDVADIVDYHIENYDVLKEYSRNVDVAFETHAEDIRDAANARINAKMEQYEEKLAEFKNETEEAGFYDFFDSYSFESYLSDLSSEKAAHSLLWVSKRWDMNIEIETGLFSAPVVHFTDGDERYFIEFKENSNTLLPTDSDAKLYIGNLMHSSLNQKQNYALKITGSSDLESREVRAKLAWHNLLIKVLTYSSEVQSSKELFGKEIKNIESEYRRRVASRESRLNL